MTYLLKALALPLYALAAFIVLALANLWLGPVAGVLLGLGLLGWVWPRPENKPQSRPVPHKPGSREIPRYTLPQHLAEREDDLHPMLERLYRALHHPDALRQEAEVFKVRDLLPAYQRALEQLFESLERFKRKIVEAADCDDATAEGVVAQVARRLDGLLRAYGDIFTALAEQPDANPLIRLERNTRANLERLSMWLADIQLTLQDPERILWAGGDGLSIECKLHFTHPDDLAQLATWADAPSGYDAGRIREALAGHSQLRPAPSVRFMPAKPASSRKSDGLDWVTPFAIGWIVGDWLFDDDDDDGA